MKILGRILACEVALFGWLVVCAVAGRAAHGHAMWDDLKYPPGFTAFDYVNPDAPKGGELRLVSNQRYSTFDKFNPFTLKGAAPAYLAQPDVRFAAGRLDGRDGSGYGLLAEDVDVAPDRLERNLQPPAARHASTTARRSWRRTSSTASTR